MVSHLRTTVTMLVLLTIVAAGAWYGWNGLRGDSAGAGSSDDPASACETPAPVVTRAGSVTVSVYNGGAPSGTGGRVMAVLTRRGFQRGAVEIVPDGSTVEGTEIWTRTPGSARVKLVRQHFEDSTVVAKKGPGPGVNVVLGKDYGGTKPGPRELTVQPEPTC